MSRSRKSNARVGGERLKIVITLVIFVGLSGLIFVGNRHSRILGKNVATSEPTPTPKATPTPTLSSTPTPTPTLKLSPNPSSTPTKTPIYTPTPTPIKIPTPTPGSPAGGTITPTPSPNSTPIGIEVAPLDTSSEPDLGSGLEEQVLDEIDISGSDQFDFKNTDDQLFVNTVEASGAGRKISQKNLKRLTLSLAKDRVESKVELRAENGEIKLKSNKVEAETKLPITLDKTTDKLLIKTPNKTEEIQILPDQADQIIRDSGLENEIKKIEIVQSTFPANNEDIVYRFTGAKSGKVLGFLPIRGKVDTEVGVETGKIVGIREFFLTRILFQFFK